MEHFSWRLVSPAGARGLETSESPSVRRAHTRTVGFLSNRKPNTEAVQRVLAGRLTERRPAVTTVFYQKANSAVGATAELLDRVGGECAVVINGTGD